MHFYSTDISQIQLPEMFTFPFHYTPHPLCIIAAEEVQAYLKKRTEWADELNRGKMFGVMVVRNVQGELGFLAAFSGVLAGSNQHDFFVPPIYDILHPNGYFKQEELEISGINRRIQLMKQSSEYQKDCKELDQLTRKAENILSQAKEVLKASKQNRDIRRKTEILDEKALSDMIKESQFQKAEFKRLEAYWKERIAQQKLIVEHYHTTINLWKEERKNRSSALQNWIFKQFRLLNALGEKKDLLEIFSQTPQQIPPSGAGECAAPKLLQHAYNQKLEPLAMAEFWWGNSPKGEIRRHEYYYPACKLKCEPILSHMLTGLNIEPNPLMKSKANIEDLETIFEDDYILVVNKPAGMLSVPGTSNLPSVYSIIKTNYPEATGPIIIHRLDMDTSGLLVIAKDKKTHELLQEQFEKRKIKKRYIALLDGIIDKTENKGFIRLPLCPDYENRPIQKVDYEKGKAAITRYEELGHTLLDINGQPHICTRIAYYPETGRTHQLRVHSAHPNGMNCPIVGDTLYGQPNKRLYLHAEQLEFRHPYTLQMCRFKKEAPFDKNKD